MLAWQQPTQTRNLVQAANPPSSVSCHPLFSVASGINFQRLGQKNYGYGWLRGVKGGYVSMATANTNQKFGPSHKSSLLGMLSSPVFCGQWNQFSVSGLKNQGYGWLCMRGYEELREAKVFDVCIIQMGKLGLKFYVSSSPVMHSFYIHVYCGHAQI